VADLAVGELCGRCLAIVDVRIGVVAEKRGAREGFSGSATDSWALARWVIEKLADHWTIWISDYTRAFEPVATWQGDPVCEMHLRECRERELRGRDGFLHGRY